MGKEKKHIDDLFRDRMKGQPLPLDGSEWNRLFDELHPDKKRRGWWWFVLPGLLIIGAALVTYNLVNRTNDSESDVTTEVVNDPAENTNISSPETSNNPTDTEETSLQEQKDDADANGSDNTTSVVSNPSPGNDIVPSGYNPVGHSPSSVIKTNPTTVDPQQANQNMIDQDLVTVFPKNTIVLNTPWPITQATPTYVLPYVLKDSSAPKTHPEMYLGLNLGANQMNQFLSSSDDIYSSTREKNENPAILPDLGVDLNLNFSKFQAGTGLHYLQKGQTNSAPFTYWIYDSIPHRNGNGDTTGWGYWNYRDTTVQGLKSPRYTYVSIPLSFGKALPLSEKITLDLGLSGNLQYLIKAEGHVLNTQYKPTSIESLNDFRRLSMTYGGYLGLGYAVNKRMKLQFVTHYDSDVRNMMQNADIRQRMSGFGGDISVQFRLK